MRGMGRVFQRGGVWWIAYYHRGKEIRESSGSPEAQALLRQLGIKGNGGHDNGRKCAEKFLKHRRDELAAERQGLRAFLGPSQERVLFSELLEGLIVDYRNNRRKSLKKLEAHLQAVRQAFGSDRAIEVTEARIERYKAARLAEGKAPATINRELAAIKRAFRLAVKQKRITTAPSVELLVERNARQGFFERGEFEAVVANLPEPLQDFTRFAYLSAWRRGESGSLLWSDVDREGRVIRLRPEASKSGEGRTLTLEGDLWNLIERRWLAREHRTRDGQTALSPYVFHRDGAPIGDFRKAWESACKAAGLAGKLFHDLRRTAVRNMVRAGVPQSVAMKISGHKTEAVFRRYDITSEADIREAVRKTQAHVNAQPTTPTVVPLAKAVEAAAR